MRMRAPAYPLITIDPNFNVWSQADRLTDTDTVHWTDRPQKIKATVTIDGKATGFVTDENGEVTLSFDGTGYCVVSATKEGVTLVPPVCAVAVSSNKLPAGDGSLVLWGSLAFVSLATIYLLKKHAHHAL